MNGQRIANPPATWDQVRAECDVLDQMAAQIVLKAVDIGTMLRELRLCMSSESFVSKVETELNRAKVWAHRMMTLSFRREAVLKALADGEANDSIRSAYEYVKALPAPEHEQAERERWPSEKRGPKKGHGGRPAARAIVHDQAPEPVAPDEPLSFEAQASIDAMHHELAARIQESAAIQAEVAERIAENRKTDNIDKKRERADRLALDVLSKLRKVNDALDDRLDLDDLRALFQDQHVEEIKSLCLRIAALVRNGAAVPRFADEDRSSQASDTGNALANRIIQACGDGEWRTPSEIAAAADSTPAKAGAILRQLAAGELPGAYCASRLHGRGSQYRMIRAGGRSVDLAVLHSELAPLIQALLDEGGKNMATMSPPTVLTLAARLKTRLIELSAIGGAETTAPTDKPQPRVSDKADPVIVHGKTIWPRPACVHDADQYTRATAVAMFHLWQDMDRALAVSEPSHIGRARMIANLAKWIRDGANARAGAMLQEMAFAQQSDKTGTLETSRLTFVNGDGLA